MKNKKDLNQYFQTRLDNLFADCQKIKAYPDFIGNKTNTHKRDEIKILRQTYSKFIADYGLQGGFIDAGLKYQIEQL